VTIKMSDKERAGYDILCEDMSAELAMEIVEFRREKKAKITARIATALLKEYKAFGDIEAAVTTQMTRNWVGFEAEWVRPKSRNFRDEHNPSPMKTSANYGNTPPEPIPAVVPPEEMERRRQMVARMRAEGVLRA